MTNNTSMRTFEVAQADLDRHELHLSKLLKLSAKQYLYQMLNPATYSSKVMPYAFWIGDAVQAKITKGVDARYLEREVLYNLENITIKGSIDHLETVDSHAIVTEIKYSDDPDKRYQAMVQTHAYTYMLSWMMGYREDPLKLESFFNKVILRIPVNPCRCQVIVIGNQDMINDCIDYDANAGDTIMMYIKAKAVLLADIWIQKGNVSDAYNRCVEFDKLWKDKQPFYNPNQFKFTTP